MGSRLVFTITGNGGIQGLLKDDIINTAGFGKRKIKRITEIKHNEDQQRFYVVWLEGPYRGSIHTYYHARLCGKFYPAEMDGVVYFDTYQQAVDHEIECVNSLRKQGHNFEH